MTHILLATACLLSGLFWGVPQAGRAWSLVAVGDVAGAGSMQAELDLKGYDFPFTNTAKWLKAADLAFANLEGPVTVRGTKHPGKSYTFRMHPKFLQAVKRAGIDVVSLANNHILDYGEAGLDDTLKALQTHKIFGCGAGHNIAAATLPARVKVNRNEISFLCFSNTFPESFYATVTRPGTAYGYESEIRRLVQEEVSRGRIVFVSFHWGTELRRDPRDYQIALAHAAIDEGASAVFGHHPHVLQGIEIYKGKPVLYSMGNFAFGSFSRNVTYSALFELTLKEDRVQKIRALPLDVYNPRVVFVPTALWGARGMAALRQFSELSAALHTTGTVVDGWWQWSKDTP